MRVPAVGAAALVALLGGCGKEAPPAMGWPPASVDVVEAVAKDVPVYLDAIGRCLPSETVVVRALVTGRVTHVSFVDGAEVEAGKPLFTVDPRPFEARRDEAKAREVSARAAAAEATAARTTAEAKVGTARSRLAEAAAWTTAVEATAAATRADVEAATAEAARATDDARRQEELAATGRVSGQDLDRARSDAQASEARAEAAKRRQASALAQVRQAAAAAESAEHGVKEATSELAEAEARVASAKAAVDEAVAAVRTAELEVEWTTVKAPIAGRLGRRFVDAGNVATANATDLVTIHKTQPAYVEFTVPETDLEAVRAAAARETLRVEVAFPGSGAPAPEGEPVTGTLSFLDNEVEGGTGTLRLRATVENRDGRCWPGRFARVRLVLGTRAGAVLVPAAAPQVGPVGMFVYVVAGTEGGPLLAELRPVVVGQRHGDLVVVEGPVKAGERVVTQGHVGVRPGGPVAVVPPPPAPGAGAPPR